MDKIKELEALKERLNVLIQEAGGLKASKEDQQKIIALGREIEDLENEISNEEK